MPPRRKRSVQVVDEIPSLPNHYEVCDQCRAKKIRCGREKPDCDNCKRQGSPCEWSGEGKKPNQTALLGHTVLGLGNRIEQLENQLLEMQKRLSDLDQNSSASYLSPPADIPRSRPTKSPRTSSTCSDVSLSGMNEHTRSINENTIITERNTNRKNIIPLALEYLLDDTRDFIGRIVLSKFSKNSALAARATWACQQLENLAISPTDLHVDTSETSPTAPPLAWLDAMTEPYFNLTSPCFWIWSRESIARLKLILAESKDMLPDRSAIVCSSNLVLLALSAKARQWQAREHEPSGRQRSEMLRIANMIKVLVVNAKRALKHLYLLLTPSLINLQALVSLCMVAREHLTASTFSLLHNLAAQVAKNLHSQQRRRSGNHNQEADIQTPKHLLSCLYLLDNTSLWMSADSVRISGLKDILDHVVDRNVSSELDFRIELATIEKEIYVQMCKDQTETATQPDFQSKISKLQLDLHSWWNDAGLGQEFYDQPGGLDNYLRMDLFFGFRTARLLLSWPSRHGTSANDVTSDARSIMQLMLRCFNDFNNERAYATLSNMVLFYPPLALIRIFEHIVSGEGDKSDVELMRFFLNMLQFFAEHHDRHSYAGQLYQFAKILAELACATILARGEIQNSENPRCTYFDNIQFCKEPLSTYGVFSSPQHATLLHANSDVDVALGGTQNSWASVQGDQLLFSPMTANTNFSDDFGGSSRDQVNATNTLIGEFDFSNFDFSALDFSGEQNSLRRQLDY